MSNNEVPQQGGPVNDFDELEMPPVPARWDDPPSMLGEDDLTRMAPGRNDDDPLLAAVSDDLWAPVELNETPEANAERLASIIEGGAQLRERWAEAAALEEAYTAPTADSVPTQVRMRKARIEKSRQRQEQGRERRIREIRRTRLAWRIRSVTIAALAATAAFAVVHGSGFTVSIVANIVVAASFCAERLGTTGILRSRVRSCLRRRLGNGAVMKKPE
ncbi:MULTISPECIES: hypothetical protein [unclassified Streptomyces]|uniref:hypothetical protein n=1 Tax=unclassified Streptomyces TaxID=2593676 RepID=UPI001BAE8884|nr:MULTISPECIES: hypothetical protein [unclassified Streptomyces]QUW88832.1 hypothetical protein KE639_00005 [Streptomyces sp. V17-9]QUW96078.1 hypothetical protein KE639_07348 [Streptomyces sp. V17-9]